VELILLVLICLFIGSVIGIGFANTMRGIGRACGSIGIRYEQSNFKKNLDRERTPAEQAAGKAAREAVGWMALSGLARLAALVVAIIVACVFMGPAGIVLIMPAVWLYREMRDKWSEGVDDKTYAAIQRHQEAERVVEAERRGHSRNDQASPA